MSASRRMAALVIGVSLLMGASAGSAQPLVLRVPRDYPSIQVAIDAASPGDQVRVGPGQWCGATVTKRLDLVGEGRAAIVGCPAPAPVLLGLLRIGFFLPDGAASGTAIRQFIFDGRGVSNDNLDPLAFAVFARDADDVVVAQNRVLGTIQAVTNTRGHRWSVSHNVVEGLTALTCDGFCGGGDAIVFQARPVGVPRGADNTASFNVITGAVPDGLDEFSMVGILAIAQDGVVVTHNRIAIPDNPQADGAGQAIVVTDACCGLPAGFLTSINSFIVDNDGRGSEFALVIETDFGGGTGNSEGAVLRGNLGVNDINGSAASVRNRSIHTLLEFP